MSSFISFSLLSGLFGAAASCLAKFAFSDDTFLTEWTLQTCHTIVAFQNYCHILTLVVRGLCFVGMLALNIFMVGSFLEGMEESGSVAGTAMANAANFVASSFFGFVLWNEEFSTTWMFGFALVIVGTMLLSTVKAGTPAKSHED